MSQSEKLVAVMKRNIRDNPEKAGGKLTNNVTLTNYRNNIDKFCHWAEEKGIKREHHIVRQGYTPTSLIQEYTDTLVKRKLSAATVHTYIAPVCKAFGISMSQIRKPPRKSGDIVRNTKLKQNAAGARQELSPRFERIVRFARIVTIRPQAMVALTIDNLMMDENGDWLIVKKDKGGKESIQYLFPHEVAYVRMVLSTDKDGKPLKPGEHPFKQSDLGQIAYSKFRYERAQMVEAHFDRLFNSWIDMPRETPAQQKEREDARIAAEAARKEWIEKLVGKYRKYHPKAPNIQIAKFREQLEKPSKMAIRGGNRERAIELRRPISYDRVSLKIASVYAMSHWSDESTIRNYLTK